MWSCLHLSLALARKVWSLFCTFVWHLLDRSADGGWISLGFIIILMNYWSIGGIFNFILLKIWILHNKVVTSKKKLTWSPPISHFIHFLGYHLQDQSLYQKKKLTGVPLEKASSDIVRQPPPKKKGNSIRNIQILTSPNTKTSGTVVETLPPSNLKRDWSNKWHFCILIKK